MMPLFFFDWYVCVNNQLRDALSEVRRLRDHGNGYRGVSRLDSFIRRLQAQRACLDMAAGLIADIDGLVLELGLGNGRTYDHLRETLPGREIYVCERSPRRIPIARRPPIN